MNEERICLHCRHWDNDTYRHEPLKQCLRIEHISVFDNIKQEEHYEDSPANFCEVTPYASDYEDYSACLMTPSRFGCVPWEPKEANP